MALNDVSYNLDEDKEKPPVEGPLVTGSVGVNAEMSQTPHKPDDKLTEIELGMLGIHGWLMHYVASDSTSPTGTNIHTHGMTENLKHIDLQCVAVIPPDLAILIFHNIVRKIKVGTTYKDGDVVDGIIEKFNIKFVAATEGGRPVLRIIVPDRNGNVERNMDSPFDTQYGDLPLDIYKDEIVFMDPALGEPHEPLANNISHVTEGDPELNGPRSPEYLGGITGPGGSLP